MGTSSFGAIRLTRSRVTFCVAADDGQVIDAGFDISGPTAHALRHLLAAQVDPVTGGRVHCQRRTLLERALHVCGAATERVEVFPGDPPRLALAMVTPTGVLRRIDLDLVHTVELLASHRIPAVAVGWPERDWDLGLRELSG